MTRLRDCSPGIRGFAALLLALLLALRLLNPDGFMPAFERGSVSSVACPDFDGGAAPIPHHHGSTVKAHCPYAASGSAAAPMLPFLFATILLFGATFLPSRTYRFLERQRAPVRPPSHPPPRPARA